MPISFGGKPQEEDVVSLIAARKYARAIELLKAQLARRGANPSLRMQLADVLILAEKKNEAVALLLPLADQYASEGFAAKAVSVLKKVQKVDPGRRDVDAALARLIEEKQREAVPGDGPSEGGPALEIGLSMDPISVFAPAGRTASEPAAQPAPEVAPVEPQPVPVREAEPTTVLEAEPLPVLEAEPMPVLEAEPVPVLEADPVPVLEAEPVPAAAGASAGVEDYDLLYAADEDEDALPLALEVEPEPAEPMSAGQFADELMALVDSVFQEAPAAGGGPGPGGAGPGGAVTSAAGAPRTTQIVVSPLFRDFSVDEMVAVIEGLRLLSFDRGDVILREGQPGGSLYMLTSGRTRAFRKDPASGRQIPLGDLGEGAFFGEMSILTGQPRAASVVALSRCELLELDRPTLDGITGTHPHVWDVLREFAGRRAAAAPR